MNKSHFVQAIASNDFREMFIGHLGWNKPQGNGRLLPIPVDDVEYNFRAVAQLCGLQVVVAEVDELPKSALARKIDNQLRRQALDYIAIYVLRSNPKHHLWVVPLKNVDKRDLVSLEYADAAHADFLYSKIDSIEFALGEHLTIVDVKEAVHRAFYVNSEKITKDFYAGFKKQHTAFVKFISGIDDNIAAKDNRNKQWYASVMLNRLMFCYFIQKKGFLDGNPNYLRDKLAECRKLRGEDKFFTTFYLGFLRRLFADGLNHPKHDREFEQQFGRIPYLNGGMFDRHQLERDYADIDIEDQAFVDLFEFFDRWQWHLDTRVTASGRDINPDVLGYIFEQYINDRAQMGAYYTKEDITEYIGRNTILPFVFDRVARSSKAVAAMFEPDGWVWRTLRGSGDRYLFDAVKQGWTPDWRERIPHYIAAGLDTDSPGLLERRARWNERTPEPFALPTEIWRETVERLQRVDAIMAKISGGEITSINDFITYNLDIRQFAADLIDASDSSSFVYNFYDALRSVTVLDPTCGSGAFLFAAMNILEPLYYACIMRLEEYRDKPIPAVKAALEEITKKYRSNIHYFIYKSIILRNLYGVDIMVEATEIAKLRLFLKMVAVVDVDYHADNLGLDPLPDIDFNIRCGNTLVGYANEASIMSDHQGNMFAQADFEDKIKGEMDLVARTYAIFKQAQLTQTENLDEFKQAKRDLNKRLTALNDTLNHHLHNATAQNIPYEKWLSSHQPFHWVAEFYQIIHGNGGFDVIIGNPPYVEYSKVQKIYKLDNYETLPSGNLFSYIIERSYNIGKSKIAYIVQMSSLATNKMQSLQQYLINKSSILYYSIFPERPKQLFENACIPLNIFIAEISNGRDEAILKGGGINRTTNEGRINLFKCLQYTDVVKSIFIEKSLLLPKINKDIEVDILVKIFGDTPIVSYLSKIKTPNLISFRNTGGRYWKIFLNRPYAGISTCNAVRYLTNNLTNNAAVALLNSDVFWLFYTKYFDLFHLTDYMIFNFPYKLNFEEKQFLEDLGKELMSSIEENKEEKSQFVKSREHYTIFETFKPALSKPIIDEIDKVLAKHYGFTEEELDFIINYDIKYRMGDELNNDDE